MKKQIEQVKNNGYRPVLYIDSDLKRTGNEELAALVEGAEELGVTVIYSEHASALNKMRKIHVFRYGHIPASTHSSIVRQGGVIVSGDLEIPVAH